MSSKGNRPKKKGGWTDDEDQMDQSLEEEDEDEGDGSSAPFVPEVTKSGRVRKKSAKVLEMEEAEELEKQHLRRPEKSKAVPVKRSRPRPPEGVAMAVTNAPVLETGSTQGHSPQMRLLLTSGGSPPPSKKPKISSPKMMGTDVPVLAVNPVPVSAPPPPSSQEALKLKLQLGAVVEGIAQVKTPKKVKVKKETVPSLPSLHPQATLSADNSGLETDTGLKLKLMLSPKEKLASIPAVSPDKTPPKSTKKPMKKKSERSGDPESILQVQQNLGVQLVSDEKSEKSKKKKKKKEAEKDDAIEAKAEIPKLGSPSKPDLQTASLHLLAALSQATQAIPKSPAQLVANRSPTTNLVGSSPPSGTSQVAWAPSDAVSPVAVSPPPSISAMAQLPSPGIEVKQEEGEEGEIPLVIDTVGSKSAKKKKTKKDKVKGKSVQSPGDLRGPDHVPGASPDHPVYADTNVMAKKVLTFAEKKASKGKKDQDGEKPKRKRKRGYTAYMLWCNSYRGKVVEQNPGIDFATISRRLGEIWHALPEKEKMSWKRQAKKLNAKGSTLISTGKAGSKGAAAAASTLAKAGAGAGARQLSIPAAKPPASTTSHKAQSPNDEIYLGMPGVSPLDVAAHLKLLGESLSIIGARLQEHQGLIAVQGSLSVLLDSMLCALAPLTCLTTQVPEVDGCPGATHSKTLDNIAYIMPGIG